MKIDVKVQREESSSDIPLPAYATDGSAGMDLYADIIVPITLEPNNWKLVPTGLKIELPKGFEAQVRPRSGLALKHGVGMLNSPGTIDSDYRGVIGVILMNWGSEPFEIRRGDRIAQLIIAQVCQAAWIEQSVNETSRGEGGFGHTGR